MGRGRRKNRLDFGADPGSVVDRGSFTRILQHYVIRAYRERCGHVANVHELMCRGVYSIEQGRIKILWCPKLLTV